MTKINNVREIPVAMNNRILVLTTNNNVFVCTVVGEQNYLLRRTVTPEAIPRFQELIALLVEVRVRDSHMVCFWSLGL